MAAYVIGLSEIHDVEGMNVYRQGVPATIAQYGGRLAVRGSVDEVLEGDMKPNSVVVFEFDSLDDARRWYDSPEYGAVRRHRRRSADSVVLLVQPPPG
jgi:uncharacterized protein (DUF1330 family)